VCPPEGETARTTPEPARSCSEDAETGRIAPAITPPTCAAFHHRAKIAVVRGVQLVKIGAKVVAHGRYVTFQMAEVAVPRDLFQKILNLIDGLRRPSMAAG
jgi:hypothetical protein